MSRAADDSLKHLGIQALLAFLLAQQVSAVAASMIETSLTW